LQKGKSKHEVSVNWCNLRSFEEYKLFRNFKRTFELWSLRDGSSINYRTGDPLSTGVQLM